jgi:hypothetical protein
LQRLREIADGADDVFVAVDAERDDGDEAEGEPWVAFYDSCGPVPAVMTLAENSFIAFELGGEFMFSASEDETHRECCLYSSK